MYPYTARPNSGVSSKSTQFSNRELAQGLGLVRISSVTDLLRDPVTGRKPSPKSVYRWTRNGVGGVVLRTIHTPYGKCVTVADLQEFFAAIGRGGSQDASPADRQRTSDPRAHQLALRILNSGSRPSPQSRSDSRCSSPSSERGER